MDGIDYYPVYRNRLTGELFDPRTGDKLIRQRDSGAWALLKRQLKRQALWLSVGYLAYLFVGITH